MELALCESSLVYTYVLNRLPANSNLSRLSANESSQKNPIYNIYTVNIATQPNARKQKEKSPTKTKLYDLQRVPKLKQSKTTREIHK